MRPTRRLRPSGPKADANLGGRTLDRPSSTPPPGGVLLEATVKRQLALIAHHVDREPVARVDFGDAPSEVVHIFHGLVANGRDHVAGLQTSLSRDRVIANRRDQHTLVDTEILRKLRADLGDLGTESPPPGEQVEIKAKPEVGSAWHRQLEVATGPQERLLDRGEPGRSARRDDLVLRPRVFLDT